jgi:CRP-like cAMP-binding protein
MDEVAAALSPAGLIGQLPFLLLIAAILSARIDRSRRLVGAAAAIGLVHALAVQGGAVAALWWGLLLGATLLVIGRRVVSDSRTRFSEEEEGMLRGALSALPRSRARHLLDQGFWLNGSAGDVLLREDEPVSHLYYLSQGQAGVTSHGRRIATCGAGELIGEVAILSRDHATATVVLDSAARFWCAPAAVLQPYLQIHDDVRHALEQGFAASIKNKLRQSNERIAGAGGVTPEPAGVDQV